VNLTISGLPALIVQVGFVVVFAAPIWLAARMVGADRPTLWRSIVSLVIGILGTVVSVATTGALAVLLAPLAFLVSFKYVLGTSAIGSIVLALLAIAGYAAMVHFIGAALSVTDNGLRA
jgi:hypothetical protein